MARVNKPEPRFTQNGICGICGEDFNMFGGCRCNGYTHGSPMGKGAQVLVNEQKAGDIISVLIKDLKPDPNGVVVVKIDKDVDTAYLRRTREQYLACVRGTELEKQNVLFLSQDLYITTLSEDMMRNLGWVKQRG